MCYNELLLSNIFGVIIIIIILTSAGIIQTILHKIINVITITVTIVVSFMLWLSSMALGVVAGAALQPLPSCYPYLSLFFLFFRSWYN